MRLRRPLVVVVLVTAALHVAIAQQQPPTSPTPGSPTPQAPARATPARDAPPTKGTAILRGYVTAADTGAPVRRAVVRVFTNDPPTSNLTQTDAQGRFEVRDLVAGRHSINVSKAGFVSMPYGARRPGQAGTPLTIADGQLVEKVAIVLPRGGVVVGRVLDDLGEPIAGAQVSAMQLQYSSAGRRLAIAGSATTDDLGAYRVYGLAPGEYQIIGRLREPTMTMGVSVGTAPIEGFAPTYYPGTANPAEGQRITVKAGAESSGVIFSLVSTRLARVSGRVVSSAGAPVIGVMVSLVPENLSDVSSGGPVSAQTRPDGTFELTSVAPGAYEIWAQPRGSDTPEFAVVRLTVGPEDIAGVTLTTAMGAKARGIITTDEGTALPLAPAELSFGPMPEPGRIMMGTRPQATINADWTWELPNLSGRMQIRSGVLSSSNNRDWRLKAILWNSEDVTDRAIDFVPGQVLEGFEVVFTRKITEISGLVVEDGNRPVVNATVILFSGDPERWTTNSRYVRIVRPDQSGRYELRNMPPHDDYRVVAVREMESGRQFDPEFLESLRETATRLRVNEGETKVQNLKVQ